MDPQKKGKERSWDSLVVFLFLEGEGLKKEKKNTCRQKTKKKSLLLRQHDSNRDRERRQTARRKRALAHTKEGRDKGESRHRKCRLGHNTGAEGERGGDKRDIGEKR